MLSALMISCVAGCGGGGSPDTASVPAPAGEVVSTEPAASAAPQSKANQEPEQPSAETNNQQETAQTSFAPLAIGALAGRETMKVMHHLDGDREKNIKSVIEKLRPLQVMLGTWRGTTRKEFDGFKAVDEHEWVWDLTTQTDQPALIMKSDKSPYLRSARLTWLPLPNSFEMEATDPEGKTRTFEGNYTEEVHEVVAVTTSCTKSSDWSSMKRLQR